MAKKGKAKISKIKRNNQTTNKMKKQGKLNLQRHQTKIHKQRATPAPKPEYSSESDSNEGEEWADMLDDDEQKYILSRLAKQPGLLSSLPENEETKQPKKRKLSKVKIEKHKPERSDSGAESDTHSEESVIEDKYEKEISERPAKKMRPLLPIKTKHGLLEREEECEVSDIEDESPLQSDVLSDSGMEGTAEEGSDSAEHSEPTPSSDNDVISNVQLMAARRDTLLKEKLRIGALCSSLLENPEKKLKNLYPILYLMEEKLKDGSPNLHSVRKLATLSALEVFKDILPDYQIRHQDYSNIKLKKETLTMYKYEKELLEFYKRYLQRLEKATSVLRKKKGDTRKPHPATLSLARVSLECMCGLLTARPYFNYSRNISQSLVPLLGSGEVGAVVTAACRQLFREDKKGDATLVVVRLINQLVKRREARLPASALDCLLSLNLKDVDLDRQRELQDKMRRDEKHKKRIVNLSKKEKKRNKKLKEVERELLETAAQESSSSRRAALTEVTHCLFHIYFRVLKAHPGSALLEAVLHGLTKFAEVINVEYYSELVGILQRLMSGGLLTSRASLRCARAGLALAARGGGGGEPALFHAYIYSHMLDVSVAKNHEDAKIIVEAMQEVCSRARHVSVDVLLAFAKRLATFSLQLHHNGAMAALSLLYQLTTQSAPVCGLLEVSSEVGSGRYDPYLSSAEHSRAQAARCWELRLLARHLHPAARDLAALLLEPTAGVPREIANLSPTQIFNQYDGSQLAFKPAIPPPKQTKSTRKYSGAHTWSQTQFKEYCLSVEKNVGTEISF